MRRLVLHHVLHADDHPHRLALGAAIGMFVTLTPTIGVQTALVVFLAWLLGANKVVGTPLVWISNPATLVPIFYPCYWLGRIVLRRPPVAWSWWTELAEPPDGWMNTVSFYWSRFLEIALPLWTGCLVVGLIAGWITYQLVYRAVSAHRLRRWGQLTRP
jgi:uncharacterized protein (DUF2062 family)